jgi:hypothetical protein
MIVWDDLHGLLNLFVALIFKTFTVTVLSGVHTSAKVVVLWWRRWGSERCEYLWYVIGK